MSCWAGSYDFEFCCTAPVSHVGEDWQGARKLCFCLLNLPAPHTSLKRLGAHKSLTLDWPFSQRQTHTRVNHCITPCHCLDLRYHFHCFCMRHTRTTYYLGLRYHPHCLCLQHHPHCRYLKVLTYHPHHCFPIFQVVSRRRPASCPGTWTDKTAPLSTGPLVANSDARARHFVRTFRGGLMVDVTCNTVHRNVKMILGGLIKTAMGTQQKLHRHQDQENVVSTNAVQKHGAFNMFALPRLTDGLSKWRATESSPPPPSASGDDSPPARLLASCPLKLQSNAPRCTPVTNFRLAFSAAPTPHTSDGIPLHGNIAAAGGEMIIQFTAQQGTTYQLDTEPGSLQDTRMEMRDTNSFTTIAENDDDGRFTGRSDSYIEWECQTSGECYVMDGDGVQRGDRHFHARDAAGRD